MPFILKLIFQNCFKSLSQEYLEWFKISVSTIYILFYITKYDYRSKITRKNIKRTCFSLIILLKDNLVLIINL